MSTTFNFKQLAGNMVGAYASDYAMAQSAGTNRHTKQAVRAGIANASYQAGIAYPTVAKWIESLGIKEGTAVQAVYQGLAMYGMSYVMKTEQIGLVNSLVEGVVSAYVGDMIAKQI